MNMSNGNRTNKTFGKFAFMMDEAVWQLALVSVVFLALVDSIVSIGGGSIV